MNLHFKILSKGFFFIGISLAILMLIYLHLNEKKVMPEDELTITLENQRFSTKGLEWTITKENKRFSAPGLEWTITKENKTCRQNLLKVRVQRREPAYEILDDPKIIPPSARVVARKIFKNRSLVMWSSELHMTPIKCVISLISSFGVEVLNYNLDPARCHMQDCKMREKLKVINGANILIAEPPLEKKFYEAYKNDEVMKSVDVAFCGHPASFCEFFLPLNKSVLIVPSIRYDIGRYTVERWKLLNENFKKFASKPWNVIAANNLYDAKYIQYYTGIEAQHLPSFCDYTEAEYTNEKKEFLIFRRYDRGFNKFFFDNFTRDCKMVNCSSKVTLLPSYTYRSLAQYRAVVHVPYQVSIMTFYELYRMNMPTFFPSRALLARWQVEYFLMPERSVDWHFYNQRINASIIPPDSSQKGVPDPRNEYDYDGIFYWLQYVDFYQDMPYTIIYDSIPHLISLLDSVQDNFLLTISQKMREYNVEFKKDLLNKWRDILLAYAENSPNHPN